jgi:hypothetical protein
MESSGISIVLILVFLIGAGLYFIPSIIAIAQGKRNLVAIIVSLVWALTKDPEVQQVTQV